MHICLITAIFVGSFCIIHILRPNFCSFLLETMGSERFISKFGEASIERLRTFHICQFYSVKERSSFHPAMTFLPCGFNLRSKWIQLEFAHTCFNDVNPFIANFSISIIYAHFCSVIVDLIHRSKHSTSHSVANKNTCIITNIKSSSHSWQLCSSFLYSHIYNRKVVAHQTLYSDSSN